MFWVLLLFALLILLHERRVTLATTFITYWAIMCVSGVVFYHSIGIPYAGLTYILEMTVLFYLGSLCFSRYRMIQQNRICFQLEKGTIFFQVALIVGAILIGSSFIRYGYSFSSWRNFFSISSEVRFTDHGERNWFEKIAIPYIFSCFSLDGYFLAYSIHKKEKYRLALPAMFIEIAILGILSTGKSLLIWAVVLWIAGFMVGTQEFLNFKLQKEQLVVFLQKHRWRIMLAIIVTLAFLALMMFARSQKGIDELVDSLVNYGFGQVPCFSFWYSTFNENSLQYSGGKQLLFGVLDELHLSEGAANNFPLNMELYARGVFSNIYTVFRCAIEDFGLWGSALFWFVLGACGGIVENGTQVKPKAVAYNTLLLALYVFIFLSFLISAWHYLSLMIAVVAFGLEVFYIKRLKRVRLRIFYQKD